MIHQEMDRHCGKLGFQTGQRPSSSYLNHTHNISIQLPMMVQTSKLFIFRQYGLWDRYSNIYPDSDLVYTVGASNYSKDWFFAHVPRKTGDDRYRPTTWQIKYNLQDVNNKGTYTLQMAIAAASFAEVELRFNDPNSDRPHFTTRRIGYDNAVPRHGIHGLYRLYSIEVPGYRFRKGNNTIYLTQTRSGNPFEAVMYDYIRLEGPNSLND
ncbi:hypothetical protein Godav_020644 [Gossypium davidsonii]|uniref:Rhamnogalacturonan lyase domain-containing protein n=1 Tax=Gossypium davidsonii TaxID=34287 RepID=A0A7J8R3J4_GOSDV|nr:hypothetical protein [Gossypium davidsonii]